MCAEGSGLLRKSGEYIYVKTEKHASGESSRTCLIIQVCLREFEEQTELFYSLCQFQTTTKETWLHFSFFFGSNFILETTTTAVEAAAQPELPK